MDSPLFAEGRSLVSTRVPSYFKRGPQRPPFLTSTLWSQTQTVPFNSTREAVYLISRNPLIMSLNDQTLPGEEKNLSPLHRTYTQIPCLPAFRLNIIYNKPCRQSLTQDDQNIIWRREMKGADIA
jgi:hypothetical protein